MEKYRQYGSIIIDTKSELDCYKALASLYGISMLHMTFTFGDLSAINTTFLILVDVMADPKQRQLNYRNCVTYCGIDNKLRGTESVMLSKVLSFLFCSCKCIIDQVVIDQQLHACLQYCSFMSSYLHDVYVAIWRLRFGVTLSVIDMHQRVPSFVYAIETDYTKYKFCLSTFTIRNAQY